MGDEEEKKDLTSALKKAKLSATMVHPWVCFTGNTYLFKYLKETLKPVFLSLFFLTIYYATLQPGRWR